MGNLYWHLCQASTSTFPSVLSLRALCCSLRSLSNFGRNPPPKFYLAFTTHLDLVGFALFAQSVIQLLLALQCGAAGGQHAWNSSVVIGLFCGAGATFIVFLIWDFYKKDDALIPVSLAKRLTVWSSALSYSFMMATMFAVSYFLPIYFQAVKDLSAVMSGVNLLPTILPQIVFAIGSGVLGKSGTCDATWCS